MNDAFCMACGQSLPAEARYCLRCGAAQAEEELAKITSAAPREEWCELHRVKDGRTKWVFVARAVGLAGRYEAGRSPQFKDDPSVVWNEGNDTALDSLLKELTAAGWDVTDREQEWWQFRFSRYVSG